MNKIITTLILGLTSIVANASIHSLQSPASATMNDRHLEKTYEEKFNSHLSDEDIVSLRKYQKEQTTMLKKCIIKVGIRVGSRPEESTKEKRNAFLGCVTVEYLNELKKYDLPDNLVYWALTSATKKLIVGFSKYDQ